MNSCKQQKRIYGYNVESVNNIENNLLSYYMCYSFSLWDTNMHMHTRHESDVTGYVPKGIRRRRQQIIIIIICNIQILFFLAKHRIAQAASSLRLWIKEWKEFKCVILYVIICTLYTVQYIVRRSYHRAAVVHPSAHKMGTSRHTPCTHLLRRWCWPFVVSVS